MARKYLGDTAFYTLARLHGKPARVIHKERSELNPVTGKQEFVVDEWSVKRALLLDETLKREQGDNLGATYGGLFDQNNRIIVITKREMPEGKDFNTNDQVYCEGEWWRVKERLKLREVSAYAAKIERVSNV